MPIKSLSVPGTPQRGKAGTNARTGTAAETLRAAYADVVGGRWLLALPGDDRSCRDAARASRVRGLPLDRVLRGDPDAIRHVPRAAQHSSPGSGDVQRMSRFLKLK
jgi:hypothetical protein